MGLCDWPRKIENGAPRALDKEMAYESKALQPGNFGYDEFGGYQDTHAKATGFFHVEQVNGKWWFVDPIGHFFLSTSVNGIGGRGGRGGGAIVQTNPASNLLSRRMDDWGFNTGGQGMNRPCINHGSMPRGPQTPSSPADVYSDEFAKTAEQTAVRICAPRKDDPW